MGPLDEGFAALICMPDNVSETEEPSNSNSPVFVAAVSVSTLVAMLPVNKTPWYRNAFGVPDNGIWLLSVPALSVNVITIVPPAATLARDVNVMTKG